MILIRATLDDTGERLPDGSSKSRVWPNLKQTTCCKMMPNSLLRPHLCVVAECVEYRTGLIQ